MKNVNILLGNEALSFSIVDNYWKSRVLLCDPSLERFIRKESKFLSAQECVHLNKLTYESPELPFGKFDQISKVGMVATKPVYCDDFNKMVVTALKRISQSRNLSLLVQKMIKCFVPLSSPPGINNLRNDGSGKSCHWLKGAVFLSAPVNHPFADLEFALNIVHELGHQILMVFQDADLIMEDISKPVYSSIRRTNRPAILSFHALVAVYFMLNFFNNLRNETNLSLVEIDYVDEKIKKLRADFSAGAFALKDIEFTPIGLLMMTEMINYSLSLEDAA